MKPAYKSYIKEKKIIISLLLLSVTIASAQSKDEAIVEQYFNSLRWSEEKTPNELIVQAALSFLDTPYIANTLEVNEEEQLIVNLSELDCMTFVENCIALSRAVQHPAPDYEHFVRELKKIRYRDGIINGYTSRLHYTTDWINNNIEKNTIEDITYALGGKKFKPNVSYMSTNPNLYPALRKNRQDVETMVEIEKRINQRSNYFFIPRSEISKKATLIKSGDIICFTTQLPGLDISHIGIAYWNKKQLSFIHASTKAKKVIINPESIADYCQLNKNNTGIIILKTLKQVTSNE